MKLILDTNIFCQDYRLAGTGFRLLWDGLDAVPAELKVPEVVVDELVNRYQEELEEALKTARTSEAVLSRLTGKVVQSPFAAIDPSKEAAAYREWFLKRLGDAGAEVLPYPEIPHKRVVERDLRKRKPFGGRGSGYRDYLIWENVRRLLLWGSERVAFITNNPRDFGEGPLVHPDLQSEITNPTNLQLFRSLSDFNEQFVRPRLRMLDHLKMRLEEEGAGPFDVRSWLKARLLELLCAEELGPITHGLPEGAGRVWPTGVVALHEITVDDAREMESRDKLVRLRVKVDVEVDVDVDWDDYLRYQEVRDLMGEPTDKFSGASWREVVELDLRVDLILDAAGMNVVTEEIVALDGPCGTIETR